MANTFVDGRVHVRRTMCSTCIGHPGNRMQLQPGRVEQMVEDCADDGCIPCHKHIHGGERIEPVCAWFFTQHPNRILGMAEAMGLIEYVTDLR